MAAGAVVRVVIADESVSDAVRDERCTLVIAAGPSGTVIVRTGDGHVADDGAGVLAGADRAGIVPHESARTAAEVRDDVSGIGTVLDDALRRGRTSDQTAHAFDAVFVLLSGVLSDCVVFDESGVRRVGDGSLLEGSGQPSAASGGCVHASVVGAVTHEVAVCIFDVRTDAGYLHAFTSVSGVGDRS